MLMRLLPLVFLTACAFPNPMSDAKEWCERISAAEQRYMDRCEIKPSGPLPNCDRVWDVAAPDDQLQKCVEGMDGAECGSLQDWPEACPRHWVRLPWE